MNEAVETILNSKAEIYTTVLVFIWAFTFFSNLLIAKIVKGDKKSWGDFWTIWLWTALLTAIVAGFLVLAADQISNLINWIKDFFTKLFS